MLSACWNREDVSLKQKILIGIRCLYQHLYPMEIDGQTTELVDLTELR